MSLLDQAKAVESGNVSKRGIYERDLAELLDLTIAWFRGEIRNHQMGAVLKIKNDSAVGARCQYYAATILKRGVAAGLVTITRTENGNKPGHRRGKG